MAEVVHLLEILRDLGYYIVGLKKIVLNNIFLLHKLKIQFVVHNSKNLSL